MSKGHICKRKTKIITTLGPASESPTVLRQLFLAGASVARLNMSHGSHADHRKRVEDVRRVAEEVQRSIAVLIDTKGPEVRVGTFVDGKAEVADGQQYTFTTDPYEGDNQKCHANYAKLHEDLKPGNTIMVNDGLLEFIVKEIKGHDIICDCIKGGTITNRKAMNFPKLALSMPFISDTDRADIAFACEVDADLIAASFVSCKENVLEIRELLKQHGKTDIDIIAKIENHHGVQNIDSILDVCDGIMIARGDMGVEIPFVELPGIQKQLILKARQKGRRVIVATEMLESMIQKPRPTRAEVSDVANAVYDGASAIMLSGETAAGKYPVECVKAMSNIALDVEHNLDYVTRMRQDIYEIKSISDATAHAAATAAHNLGAKMIIAFTKTGKTARAVSRFRPDIPVIAATFERRGYTKLALSWGVSPLFVLEAKTTQDLWQLATRIALENGCKVGDIVVVTGGSPIHGGTNIMKVIEL